MGDSFDPYHKWLGILPKDQPPHHYRLLGIELFEDDLEVIERAADRQLSFLKKYQAGSQAAACAKLLNEISKARLCLLKPAAKAAYDAELRSELESQTDDESSEPASDEPENPRNNFLLPAIGGGAALLALAIVVFVLARTGGKEPSKATPSADAVQVAKKAKKEKETESAKTPSDKVQQPAPQIDPGQLDILPLLSAKNVVRGNWKFEAGAVESVSGPEWEQLTLPVDLPPEYTLDIEVTRTPHPSSPAENFGIGFPWGTHDGVFKIADGASGLELLDLKNWNSNETTIPRVSLPPGKAVRLAAIVRNQGIEVRQDGRTILDWSGDFSRLQRAIDWKEAPPHRLFLGTQLSTYRITRLILGPPVPRARLPGSDTQPNQVINLADLVDFPRDVWQGKWRKEGASLVSDPAESDSKFVIPMDVPAEYVLSIDVEPESERKQFYLGLPFQQGFAGLLLGGGNERAGLYLERDAHYDDSQNSADLPHIMKRFPEFGTGRHVVEVEVRKGHIIVKVGGRVLFDWRGDPRRFVKLPTWGIPGQRLTIGSDLSSIRLHSVMLKVLPDSGSAFVAPPAPQNGDLLSIVNVARDTVQGGWSQPTGRIASEDKKGSAIRFPAKLPANYELRMVVERKSGGDNLSLVLPIAGKPVTVGLDFGNGSASGIEFLEGKRGHENFSTLRREKHVLPVGRPHVIMARVEGQRLHLEVNGEKLWDLDIPSDLADPVVQFRPGWLTGEERLQLELGTWFSQFEFQEVRFRTLDPNSPPFPPLNTLTPSRDSIVKRLFNANQSPSKEKFDSLALKAAKVQIEEEHGRMIRAAKDVRDLEELAKRFERLADEVTDKPELKYAYLAQALQLIKQTPRLPFAMNLVAKMTQVRWPDPYNPNHVTLKKISIREMASHSLGNIEKQSRLQRKENMLIALPLIDQALAESDYETAKDLADAMSTVVATLNERQRQREIDELHDLALTLSNESLKASNGRTRLQKKPDDPAARLAAGRWMCLQENKWEDGLKLLTIISDPTLKDLAARDIAARGSANFSIDDQRKLAAAWLKFANSKKDHSQTGFAERSLYWLEQAKSKTALADQSQLDSQIQEALAARDWNIPSGELLDLAQKAVKQQSYTHSNETGAAAGTAFDEMLPEGALLVGVDYTVNNNHKPDTDESYSLLAIRPIFLTRTGLKRGAWHGTWTEDQGVATLLAPRGFAVSGLIMQSSSNTKVVRLRYSRITPSGLDTVRTIRPDLKPSRNYTPDATFINPDSHPSVGIFGHAEGLVRGVGLIVIK